MSLARDLAEFLGRCRTADLPAQAVDHAAMLIASTLASAALGSRSIGADHPRSRGERGGKPEASLWFDDGTEIARRRGGAGQCRDERRRRLRRQRSAQHRPLRHAAHRDRARLAERTGANGATCWPPSSRLRGGRADHRRDHPNLRDPRLSRLDGRDFRRGGRGRPAAAARRRADDARHRACGDLDRRLGEGGRHQRRARIPCRARDSARHPGRAARRSTAIGPRKAFSRCRSASSKPMAARTASRRAPSRCAISARAGTSSTDMAVKLVPGGHPYHALAEAAANAAREGDIDPERGRKHHRVAAGHDRADRAAAPGRSDRHGAQPGLFPRRRGGRPRFHLGQCEPGKIADPRIHRLIDKVRVGPPPTENAARYRQGATVTIRTTDGREVTNTVYAPKGAGHARHRLGRHRREIPHLDAALRPARAADRSKASL